MPDEIKNHLMHQFTAVNVPISVNEDGEKKRRTFDAEVYSGGRIDNHYYWGRSGVVIDLQGLQLKVFRVSGTDQEKLRSDLLNRTFESYIHQEDEKAATKEKTDAKK